MHRLIRALMLSVFLFPLTTLAQPNYEETRALAEQGDASAQVALGLIYSDFEGVPRSYSEAMRWFRLAAEQGDAEAQFRLADLYSYSLVQSVLGFSHIEAEAEAVKWLRLAIEQGHLEAMLNLGRRYLTGRGVPEDLSEGWKLIRLAAEEGLADAQISMAISYSNSYDPRRQGPQNHTEAVRWFRLAAEQGDPRGQFFLGRAYSGGQGVPQSGVMAYVWFSIAAAQDAQWRAVRDEKAEELTPQELARGQEIAVRCFASGYTDCY